MHVRAEPTRRFLLAGLAALPVAVQSRSSIPVSPVAHVDRLTLTIVDDKETFGPFLPDLSMPGLTVQRAGNGAVAGDRRMRPTALAGEFGLSILCESVIGDRSSRVLLDAGYSTQVMANNLDYLGIDAATFDAAVLSHGHLDHYGGFRALGPALKRRSKPLPFYVGGEEAFCERVAGIARPPLLMGALDRRALLDAGFEVRVASQPTAIVDGCLSTGTIPLVGAERAAIPTAMRPGKGCDARLISAAKRGSVEVADDGEHELAICYVVRGRGLVVVTSCGHRGVINSIRRAQALTGVDRLLAVVGGFHLVRPRTEAEARRTVAELATIDPAYVVPMHCTGELFIDEARRVFPEKVIRPYVGNRLIFG